MATTQVDTAAALAAALNSAQGGDTILLAPGTYSGLGINGLSYAGGVTITSADPSRQAVLTDFNVTNSQGLAFNNLQLFAKAPANFAFIVKASSNIAFDHVSVHGSLDGDASNDASGLQVLNSSNISVTNSEFQQLGRGAGIGSTSNLTVSNNYVHGIRSDGFDFADVANARIEGNVLMDFSPAAGDHPDAIQFWTQGTTAASHDVVISGNVIMRGDGDGMQGIFMADETGVLPYERIAISHNLIVGTGLNALRLAGAKDLTLSNNELISFKGQYGTYILIQNADGVTATGNKAISFGFDHVTDLTQGGNVTTLVATDEGLAAVRSWVALHPATNFALGSFVTNAGSQVGDALANALNGGSGADQILAGAGNDTVTDVGGVNYLRGEDGGDSLTGGSGFDDINGNMGNDTAAGGLGDDWVVGGKDQDVLSGQGGNDIVYGNLGDDRCDGGDGNDLIRGGKQDDTLSGGAGADWLSGDRESDVITGGAGADVFHTFGAAGLDRVTDFHRSEGDRVQLDPGTTYTVAQVGSDVVITMGGGGQMVLAGVQMASLTHGWVFVA